MSDRTWERARRLSIVADAVCALMAGALAWLGFRSTRRFMSMQKVRADELEAFASRVAHDVRGPLTPALFTLQMFERDFAADEKRRTMVDRGIRSLKRVDQPPDAPVREVRVRADVQDERVRVEVADTGAGLPEAVHDRIFQPYVRVNRQQPGLGLGLATVRRLVDAHGGRVGVRSNEGTGALFWFAMPLRRARAPSSRG